MNGRKVRNVTMGQFLEALRELFAATPPEWGVTRLRIPFIIKTLAAQLRIPQYEVKRLLTEAHSLTLDWLYYEGASAGVLIRNRQTSINHYIIVLGCWRGSIRVLDPE